jgi:hypothetical protein
MAILTLAVLCLISSMMNNITVNAFTMTNSHIRSTTKMQMSPMSISMSTTTAPPKEKTDTDEKTKQNNNEEDNRSTDPDDIVRYHDAPLEYLEDEWSTREPDDPFHILLLDTTFTGPNEKITVSYVAGCVNVVTGMPEDEAFELTTMALDNGFSCLGTWEREECLRLGKQLQIRDCIVRVVPFVQGGTRGWQMKDAAAGAYGNSSSDAGSIGSGGGFFE